MAFSASKLSRSVAGNIVKEIWSFNCDGVTGGTIGTGIGRVKGASFNNEVTSGDTGTVEVSG